MANETTNPLERLKQIHRKIMDPSQVFSIRETLAELDALERKIAPSEQEARGELSYLRGFVFHTAGRPRDSLPQSLEALQIDEGIPFLQDRERTRLIYDIAFQAEDIGNWELAISFYRKAVPLFDTSAEYSEDQRLGLRERLAYCLHEARSYSDALAMNRYVLAGAERLFGPDSAKLFTVLTNLAQNAHALQDTSAARGFLERLLDLAMTHKRRDQADTALFQLGVLAFEDGRFREAEIFMKRRLEMAEEGSDADRIADAKEDLATLLEKIPR